PLLQKAVDAIELTYQSDNLTWAMPSYLQKYTMDNAEVFQGYFAAARMAQVLGENSQYTQWLSRAHAVRQAVHGELFVTSPAPGRYATAKGSSGGLTQGWTTYYPHATAN